MTTPQLLIDLEDVARRGTDPTFGCPLLPAPAAPPVGGTWAPITHFQSGQITQVWGMAEHSGAMYYGVGGDSDVNSNGNNMAQLWRYYNGTWDNVTPWQTKTMRIPSLLSSGGYIYACNASASDEVQIWRSSNGAPGTWSLYVNFGASVYHLLSLTEFDGHLYVGVNRDSGVAQVWSSSNAWAAPIKTVAGTLAYSMAEHNGALYVGTGYPAEVYKFDGATWAQVSSFNNPNLTIVEAMVSYRGKLVVAFGKNLEPCSTAPSLLCYDDMTGVWAYVGTTQPGAFRIAHNHNTLAVFKDTLVVSLGDAYGGLSVWALCDGENWTCIGDRSNAFGVVADPGTSFERVWIYRFVVLGNYLYTCTARNYAATGQPAVHRYGV